MIRSRWGRFFRSGRWMAGTLMIALATGCSDDGGPGAWTAEIADPATAEAGILLLEVAGRGIRGFEPVGNVRLWSAPMAGGGGRYRVVLLRENEGAPIRFRIPVDDLSDRRPEVSVLQGADTEDRPLRSTAVFDIRLTR